jgi:SAM-dependent methyltransferase
MALYVNYGCGYGDETCAPEGWLNFDASPTLRVERIPLVGRLLPARFPGTARYGDIRKGLPIADATADGVYCSHVLEHLALEDFRIALKNTFRMLRPGGLFRLVLPDLKKLAQEYLASSEPDAAIRFMAAASLGRPTRPKGPMGLLRDLIGNSPHLSMWDYQALAMELGKTGFVSIREAVLGDSGDAMFAKVEFADRWDGALGMQSQRPL